MPWELVIANFVGLGVIIGLIAAEVRDTRNDKKNVFRPEIPKIEE